MGQLTVHCQNWAYQSITHQKPETELPVQFLDQHEVSIVCFLRKYRSQRVPSGTPARPKGFSWPIFLSVPRFLANSNVSPVMPVSIRPGQIELTLISAFWSCQAPVLAMEFTLSRNVHYLSSRRWPCLIKGWKRHTRLYWHYLRNTEDLA